LSTLAELRLRCPAQGRAVAPVRHALRAFLEALGFDREALDDVITAAGEALANTVEHAYVEKTRRRRRDMELRARLDGEKLQVDVSDHGRFIERAPLPGRGFGLRIVRAIAHEMEIETSGGTRVRMLFPGPHPES
jgi:anti-sigma regulatory factor (Ser/Thr protein kinase)